MTRPLLFLGVTLGFVAVTVGGVNHANHVESAKVIPSSYTQFCSSCHGPEGRDFVGRTWKLGSTADDVARVIREGYELLGMPAYGDVMDNEAVDELTAYVLERAATKRGFKPTAPVVTMTDDLTVRANVLVDGLETPWGMDFLNDTTLLITEREGRIWHCEAGRMTAVTGGPADIHVRGQGGLRAAPSGCTSPTAKTSPGTTSGRRLHWSVPNGSTKRKHSGRWRSCSWPFRMKGRTTTTAAASASEGTANCT